MDRANVSDGASEGRRGRPARPVPADFEERWPTIGWSGAELEWQANWQTICRWLAELGSDRMAARRRTYLARQRDLRSRERRKVYRWPC